MDNPRFYIITGASGAGKSTLLRALGDLGYAVVPEVALSIVQEQEKRGGNLFPWTNLQVFMEEVLARNLSAYDAAQTLPSPVFFDRAVPECIGHMRILGLEIEAKHVEACRRRPYAHPVFVAEPWPEIYVTDRWRRASFARAQRSYEPTVAAYVAEGYRTCLLPKASVEERVAFVRQQIKNDEPKQIAEASRAAVKYPDDAGRAPIEGVDHH
ncbi:ATPase [Opitutaceae bacterium EW11]|nr:ATPase [Opitutaceae bacterium EW11]